MLRLVHEGAVASSRKECPVADTETVIEVAMTAVTDAGLFALWNPSRFSHVTDYSSWEASLGDDADVAEHARAGDLVPIDLDADGAFGFLIRADSARAVTLTDREQLYVTASSKPYLFQGEGTAHLSGIEYVSAAPPPATPAIGLPEGRYAVTVHLIDWAAEPGARDPSGKPADGALPDVVVLLGPAAEDARFRSTTRTFSKTPA
jgi:hypothetical protein